MVMDNATKTTGSPTPPKSRKTCCVKKTAKTQIQETRLLQMKGKTNGDVGKEKSKEPEEEEEPGWTTRLDEAIMSSPSPLRKAAGWTLF